MERREEWREGGERGFVRAERERENSVVSVSWLHSCCVSRSLLSRVNSMLVSLLDLSAAPDYWTSRTKVGRVRM